MWQSWTNALLGIWLIVAAFLDLHPTMNLWDDLVVGIIVLLTSRTLVRGKPWQGWLASMFGGWMIIAAFIPSLTNGAGYAYNDLISGIIITIAGVATFGQSQEEKLA